MAAAAGLLFGFDTAVINGALVFLRAHFHLSTGLTESAASSLLWGCLVGSSAAGALSDRFGRKRLLLVSGFLFFVSALASAVPPTIQAFLVARFIGGLGIGLASMLAPLYLAEVAPPASRGRLVSLNQFAIVLGILVAYCVNWALSGLAGLYCET